MVRKMKNKNAIGPDGVQLEICKVLESLSIGWHRKIFNNILPIIERKISKA